MDIYGCRNGGIMYFLDKLVLSESLLKAIAEIDEFKGAWIAIGNLAPERLSALKRIATIESVGSSTRIEGVTLTDDEIERLLSGLDIHSFRSRDEQEVAGYAEVMELVFDSFASIRLTENYLKQLHGVLLKYSDKDKRHRGNYKTFPNNVEAFDSQGKSMGVIFKTASPFDTPRLMTELVHWTEKSLTADNHHPILVIAVFIVRLLAVHPFQDGNGRLSRAVTTLLLLQTGYSYVPYASLERIIEDNKDEYYRVLRRAQATLDKGEEQLHEWVLFFVNSLVKQKEILNRKISEEKLISPLPPLSEKLLAFVRDHGRITVKDAVLSTGSNRNTIKDHLKSLEKNGHIVRHGKGRGAWYGKS
jgi:Fic family protein